MLRANVLQSLLDCYPRPRFLEVGTFEGTTFNAVRAAEKVAVDPSFRFEVPASIPPGVAYHEVPSDQYFGEICQASDQFEVIYLDGLHTFEQTLRDLLNAMAHLAPGGVIVIDDVIPSTFYAAEPDYGDFDRLWRLMGQGDGSWMGDVYKLVFFIQTFLQSYSFATVADNHGQLVLWQQQRPSASVVHRKILAFATMHYADVLLRKADFNILPMAEILQIIPKR